MITDQMKCKNKRAGDGSFILYVNVVLTKLILSDIIKTYVLKQLFYKRQGVKIMPPKAKFTKDEIIEAALNIVREEGMEALSARSLGLKLGSSARPIFTVFKSTEEIHQDIMTVSKKLYSEYVNYGLSQTDMPAFKGVGVAYIRFAIAEPKLFQILFMSEYPEKPTLVNVLPIIDDNYSQILDSVQKCFSLNKSNSEWLYRHLWIYSHGIAVLCATNMCVFSFEEIEKMLTEVCLAMVKKIKENDKND